MSAAFTAKLLETRPRRAAWATLSGVCAVAGFSPEGIPWLTVLGFTLLIFLWLRTSAPREAALQGFLFGAGLFGTGASWVYVSLHDFGMMPAPLAAAATLFFCAFLATFPALAGSLQARVELPPGLKATLMVPGCWVLTEWMRGWLLTGFPWLTMGYSQIDTPLSGFAPVIGVYGVSLAMAIAAGALAAASLARTAAGAFTLVAVAAGLFATGALLKKVEWVSPNGEAIAVALVQGNIAQQLKFEPEQYAKTLATYERLIRSSSARLIVLPETAIPRFLDLVDPAYLDGLTAFAKRQRADILVGVPFRNSNGAYFNGVVNLGYSDLQFYAKSHLVPLGEFVPPEFRWIVSTLRIPLSDFNAGKRGPPMRAAGELIGLTVCYEDAFGEELITQLPQASLLANLSNVAWFGDSLAPGQHLQISRMRAQESGRYMLRATNTGVTAIIDERGVVLAQLPKFAEGVLQGKAQPFGDATPYVRLGNPAVLVVCLLLVLAAVMLSLGRIRGQHSKNPVSKA